MNVISAIVFSFAFATECLRSFSIKKTVNDRMNKLMTERFSRLASQTILALATAVEAKDNYTKGHSQRVANYSREIATRMGYSEEKLEEIYYIGLSQKFQILVLVQSGTTRNIMEQGIQRA